MDELDTTSRVVLEDSGSGGFEGKITLGRAHDSLRVVSPAHEA